MEPYLRAARTTPEPIWAETPKLSAVGGEKHLALNGGLDSLQLFGVAPWLLHEDNSR